MNFAIPDVLHALWLLPILVLSRLWAESQSARTARSLVAQRLREVLILSASPIIAWVVFALQLLALAAFIVALAQPRWGEEKRVVSESGRNVIIAIDTSKSMLADDVTPNRLMRAKLAAQDLTTTLRDQRVGLIAFAGRAYLQAPLTTDHAAVIESLQALDTFTIPRGGSVISEALREALEAFAKTKARNHGLIVFSDGGDPDASIDGMLAKLREKSVKTITVGVGTETGSLIPDPDPNRQGDYLRDPNTGVPVHSRLDETMLSKIASETGGRYLRLGASLNNEAIMQALLSLESLETGNREESKLIERFYWPLGLGILFLMLAFMLRPTARVPRLSPAGAAVLLVLFSIAPAKAVMTESQSIREAQRAYEGKDFERSRDVYARLLAGSPPAGRREIYAYGLGAATHQLKDYDRAVEAFSRALRSPEKSLQGQAHQGLGNALYEQGAKALQQQPEFTINAWLDSVSHYESALAIREDKKVRENLEFVRKQLEQLKQQQQQQQQKKQQQKQKGDKKDKQKGDQQGESEEGEGEGESDQEQENDKGEGKEQEQNGQGQQPQEQGEDKKGKGEGEQQEGQQGPLPEGQIQAGEEGEPSDNPPSEGTSEEKPDDRTGFSRNEARSLLRTYNDQMQMQFQERRREQPVKRDW